MMVSVLGAGAFGTAIAQLLAIHGHDVTLWCHDAEKAKSITKTGTNSAYLPNIILHKNITITAALQEACASRLIFIAVPVKHLRSVLEQIAPRNKEQRWVFLCKGIAQDTALLPTQILQSMFPETEMRHVAVLSGPSFAAEVAQQQPTHVVLASAEQAYAHEIQTLLNNAWFSTEISDDLSGVQMCAAYKNVAALGMGMLAGAGYGENVRSTFLLHALREMEQLVAACGGKKETIYGPAGLGDLLLTCFGTQSRNRTAGMLFAKGHSHAEVVMQLHTEPEGINSLLAIAELSKKNNLTLPLCAALHEIIFDKKPIEYLLKTLKA